MSVKLPKFITKKNKKISYIGFTLVEVIIASGIIILLAAIGIPAVIKSRMVANEALAKATLRSIDNAIEMYLSANSKYPATESDLLYPSANPPYLNRSFDGQTIKGYGYNFQFNNGYTVVATPQNCGTTGTKTFTLNQNIITEVNCAP